jgi:hypothetical protein
MAGQCASIVNFTTNLNTAGVTTATLEQYVIGTNFVEWRQTPGGTLADKAKDSGEVVGEYDCGEPGTVTEASDLENFCQAGRR